MAQDATQLVVAASGDIAVAPVGTALPTTPTAALDAAFKNLGYVTEDGVTFSDSVDVEDVPAWQSPVPIRRLVTGRSKSVSFELQQWNRQNFELAFGGGVWSVPSIGVYRYDPPADEDALREYAMVIDWQDGTKDHRVVIERGNMQEGVETQLLRTGVSVLPITFAALSAGDGTAPWYHLTDDASFAA